MYSYAIQDRFLKLFSFGDFSFDIEMIASEIGHLVSPRASKLTAGPRILGNLMIVPNQLKRQGKESRLFPSCLPRPFNWLKFMFPPILCEKHRRSQVDTQAVGSSFESSFKSGGANGKVEGLLCVGKILS